MKLPSPAEPLLRQAVDVGDNKMAHSEEPNHVKTLQLIIESEYADELATLAQEAPTETTFLIDTTDIRAFKPPIADLIADQPDVGQILVEKALRLALYHHDSEATGRELDVQVCFC